MKKRKNKISKWAVFFLIPIINLCMIVSISTAFYKPKSINKNDVKKVMSIPKNEKTVSVYFHNLKEIRKVSLEDYLVNVVAAEMPPTFEVEALKAQAVAARTFIINREKGGASDKHPGACVCTDYKHCKAYITDEQANKNWGKDWGNIYKPKIQKAVNDTLGEIVTYNEEPISAVFHSTSSGHTENSEDVWQSALPYLRSVKSEGEEKSPRYISKVVLTKEEFKNKILSVRPDAIFKDNSSVWIENILYNDSGSVKQIKIGGKIFKGTEIRNIFSLRSANFNININEKVVFNVKGNGHGVGMSQYGANYMAQKGYTYDKILKKYYVDTEIKKAY